ncbi:MAG: hypothetical protein IJU92_08040 [Spirochaetaceae bacterium]|nr:hypothetical protein [Spirochaetaceae bacterium]
MKTSKKGLVALVATFLVLGLVSGCNQGTNGKSNTTSVDPFAGTTWECLSVDGAKYKLRFNNDKTVEYLYLAKTATSARSSTHEYKLKRFAFWDSIEYEAEIINPTNYTEYYILRIETLDADEGIMCTSPSYDGECDMATYKYSDTRWYKIK